MANQRIVFPPLTIKCHDSWSWSILFVIGFFQTVALKQKIPNLPRIAFGMILVIVGLSIFLVGLEKGVFFGSWLGDCWGKGLVLHLAPRFIPPGPS